MNGFYISQLTMKMPIAVGTMWSALQFHVDTETTTASKHHAWALQLDRLWLLKRDFWSQMPKM
jgi:hypothetical protein